MQMVTAGRETGSERAALPQAGQATHNASKGTATAPNEKIHALTSLRFFAALYVVLYHTLWDAMPGITRASPAGLVLSLGYLSVSFFFLLSGYILSMVYLRRERPVELRPFYIARFARVYPLFFLTLVAGTPFLLIARIGKYGIGGGLSRTAGTFLANVFMLQAWIPQLRGIDNPNWSLSVETLFYLLFPILGVAIWKLRGARLAVAAGSIWIASQAITQLAYPHLPVDVMELDPLLHLGTFALGIVLARWQTLRKREYGASPGNGGTVSLALAFACIAFAGVVAWGPRPEIAKLSNGLLAPIFAALIWAFSDNRSLPARLLSAPWMVVLGEASYGLYLIHYVAYQLWQAMGLDHIRALYPLYLAGCIGLSVLSLYFVETPARRWIMKQLHARPKETMEAASGAQ